MRKTAMKKPVLALAAIVGGGLLLFGGRIAYGASRLLFYISKISPRLDGLTPIIDIDIMVQNPSGTSFVLNSFVAEVFFNNATLGNASVFNTVTVPGYAQAKIVVPVRLSLGGAASTLFQLLQGQLTASATLRVKGTATVNSVPLPIDINSKIV